MELAKWIVVAVAVFNAGGYVADAVVPFGAKQHLDNPRWPPHAKFHNGQSMLMGIGLGLLSLVVLFAPGPLTRPRLALAAGTAGLYFVSMLCAPLLRGTGWVDPEFAAEQPAPLGLPPQQLVSLVVCALLVVALALAYSRP